MAGSEFNAPSLPTSHAFKTPSWKSVEVETKESSRRPIIYQSDSMTQLMKIVDRVAPSQANILVLGESGTGKELMAHALHDQSHRAKKPFVAINCSALRDTLLESELFGHEKGSFTGAYQRKIGLAEAAEGGTLFLDEVGEMAPSVQAKLLRFLQEGEIYRVGGKDPIRVDVRIIAATNRDLEKDVTQGKFREDLYYRINTIVISVPPLRRRKEDIPKLVHHFLTAPHQGLPSRSIEDSAMASMVGYDWPGNIRELQNVCERLRILSDGNIILYSDIPEHIRAPKQKFDGVGYDPSMTIGELEKRYILKALSHFGGNKTQAANALGITIKTLYNKLHEYGEFENFAVHPKMPKGEA